MSCLGNIIWIIFGGFFNALGWFIFAGLELCIANLISAFSYV